MDCTRKHLPTPKRKRIFMSLSRRSYKATSSQVVNSEDLKEPIIIAMANKAREEMKALNFSSCKSMLRDSPKTLAV